MSSVTVEVVALALKRKSDSKYLIAKRNAQQSGAGFWEFPGGKVESNESQQQALVREIQEELNFEIHPEKLLFICDHVHQYPEKKIHLFLWFYETDSNPQFQLIDHDETAWCAKEDLLKYRISEADLHFVHKLL